MKREIVYRRCLKKCNGGPKIGGQKKSGGAQKNFRRFAPVFGFPHFQFASYDAGVAQCAIVIADFVMLECLYIYTLIYVGLQKWDTFIVLWRDSLLATFFLYHSISGFLLGLWYTESWSRSQTWSQSSVKTVLNLSPKYDAIQKACASRRTFIAYLHFAQERHTTTTFYDIRPGNGTHRTVATKATTTMTILYDDDDDLEAVPVKSLLVDVTQSLLAVIRFWWSYFCRLASLFSQTFSSAAAVFYVRLFSITRVV